MFRAERPVFPVDVLNHPLAAIAARQIEIDVGPLAALLRQEALEQQIHADRIDGGDAEAVADGAVGRRAAALHEDVFLAAEVDDVPDDQEVAGEIELLDQIELALDLPPGALVIRPVALARARLRHLAQERRHRLAGRHGVFRKAVAEIGHRVFEPLGQLARAGESPRAGRRTAAPSRRAPSDSARHSTSAAGPPGQRGLVADAGEDVVERPIGRLGEADAVGGDERQVEGGGQIDQRMVVGFLVAQQVPLQLDATPPRPNTPTSRSTRPPTPKRGAVDRASADQRHEPADCPSRSSSVSTPSPFGARSFIRVISRHRLR